MLLDRGKAELMEDGRGYIYTITTPVPVPSIIRLFHMVKRPLVNRRLSRRAVFVRDKFACQYCSKESKALTLDHILPRSRGGPHTWENVVSACIPCNHRKAGRTPKEARMELLRKPIVPAPNPYYLFMSKTILDEWRPFIPWAD